jgi:hypothetical protein
MEQSVSVEMKIAAHYKILRANGASARFRAALRGVKEGG